MTFDAAVVGGSVAGSIAARELGRRGIRTALFEKARFPRFKACGEGLLPHGVRALEAMGLDPPGVRVRGIRYVSPSGIRAACDFPWGHGLVVRRDRFDDFLFRAASATPNVEVFGAYDGRPARWIVAADGLRSQFHRRVKVTRPRVTRVGFSTHVRGLEIDRDRVEVVLYNGGEIYIGPSDPGEALIACLCYEVPRAASNEARVRSILERHRNAGRIEFTSPVLAVAPLGLRVAPVAKENVLLVGDAAGAPDPVTGEGMSLAIRSAEAAAEAIASGDPRSYVRRRAALAQPSDWLGRWILRAARHPKIADRAVKALADRPELFRRLLSVALGEKVGLAQLARLVL